MCVVVRYALMQVLPLNYETQRLELRAKLWLKYSSFLPATNSAPTFQIGYQTSQCRCFLVTELTQHLEIALVMATYRL